MVSAKDKLLAELEQVEEVEQEPVVLPNLRFDYVKKIAYLLETSENIPMNPGRLTSSEFSNKLLCYYMLEGISKSDIDVALQEKDDQAIQKLILIDVAPAGHYEFNQELEKTAIDVAAEAYKSLYAALAPTAYTGSYDAVILDKEDYESDKEDYVFAYFKGSNIDALIAAEVFSGYIEGFERKVEYINSIGELKLLLASKIYYDLIKDNELKKDIMSSVNDNNILMGEVYTCTILNFHKDFFKIMENFSHSRDEKT